MTRQSQPGQPRGRGGARTTETATPGHAEVLAALRHTIRPYVSGPLPDWDAFVASTSYFNVEPRTNVACTDRDVFLLVRGIVKLVRPDEEDDAGAPRIYEFFEAPAMLAPRTKPRWAQQNPPPVSGFRWSPARWSVAKADVVAVERCTLLRMNFRVIEQLAARHAAWGEVITALLWTYVEGIFATAEFTHSRTMDVEARMTFMRTHRANLLQRVSQREIAAYLNITESALSRVMRRVRDREAGAT